MQVNKVTFNSTLYKTQKFNEYQILIFATQLPKA